MKKIALIHYMPLEYYPPVTNMLDSLSRQSRLLVKVWTTKNIKNRPTYCNSKIAQIQRFIFPKPQHHKIWRLCTYLWFNLRTFLGLLVYNPSVVIYYESYSVGPVYWYWRYFGKGKRLFIHYHEYFDRAWYNQGMAMVKRYYKYEQGFLWSQAEWISHTNPYRRALFLKEHPALEPKKIHIMPNYPPKTWATIPFSREMKSKGTPLKVVYIGSLSLEHTFIYEFCEWIKALNGRVFFDIYAYNCSIETDKYLKSIKENFVIYHNKGVPYQDIPKLLSQYNVGVILYKGTSLNAKFCASNKLFEYLVCGLDVWISKEQIGSHEFENLKSRPRVQFVDFGDLEISIIEDYKRTRSLPLREINYNFSVSAKKFISNLMQ